MHGRPAHNLLLEEYKEKEGVSQKLHKDEKENMGRKHVHKDTHKLWA
jgi:hypothetical protein